MSVSESMVNAVSGHNQLNALQGRSLLPTFTQLTTKVQEMWSPGTRQDKTRQDKTRSLLKSGSQRLDWNNA